jgi:Family of unknown function (DUF6328)
MFPRDHESARYSRDGEGHHQRLDRHWNELLQELRLAQTGTQILFAFLLGVGFQARFQQADDFTHAVYVGTLIASALAAGLLLAPVSFHRIVFKRRLRDQLIRIANQLAHGGMAILVLALAGGVLLATDIVLSRTTAITIASAVVLWFLLFWYALPTYVRRTGRADDRDDSPAGTSGFTVGGAPSTHTSPLSTTSPQRR